MFDDFHTHLVGNNLKTQESNMSQKCWGIILTTKQRNHISFLSIQNSYQGNLGWIWILLKIGEGHIPLHSFWVKLLNMQKVQKGLKSLQINSNTIFVHSHLSAILDRNIHADLWLSCSSQMSVIVTFVQALTNVYLEKTGQCMQCFFWWCSWWCFWNFLNLFSVFI